MSDFITDIDILEESKNNFLTYVEEVLTDRAIPNAEDGLLSSHRKILWTITQVLKMNCKSKFKKSASIIGSTLSTSYYHGDAACYGALCKLAQPYLMRYPLIESDGNIGTQEGNGMEASQRYTNTRPTIYADLLFTDFEKNSVPLKETYNGEYMEPVFLPAHLPNALINGREAIAVGMSHSSLPHNLKEVCDGIIAFINNNDITAEELMEYIKGPDFPLGGVVINQKDILENFISGHGTTIKVRGDYEIKDNLIIFNTIPYRTYRNKIKEQISKNVDKLETYIEDFRDESNVGYNKLVFEIKKGVNPQSALQALFANTDLQTSVSYNMNFIINGTPKLCSMIGLIKAYVDHQHNVITNSAIFDKEKSEKRIHILEGLILAVDKIEEVIQIIKTANDKTDALNKLMSFLNITEKQGNAILDMKLGRLTKISKDELMVELDRHKNIVKVCDDLIENKTSREQTIIDNLNYLKNTVGDDRRTVLTNIQTSNSSQKEIVPPEPCKIILTHNNKICRTISNVKSTLNNYKIKTMETDDSDVINVFTSAGKLYRLAVKDLTIVTSINGSQDLYKCLNIPTNEKILYVINNNAKIEDKYIIFATKEGMLKKSLLEDYLVDNPKTKNASKTIKFKTDTDQVVSIFTLSTEFISLVTKNGFGYSCPSVTINPIGVNASGVKGINLQEDDQLVSCCKNKTQNGLVIISENGYVKKIHGDNIPVLNRGAKGNKLIRQSDKVGSVAYAASAQPSKEIIVDIKKSSYMRLNPNEIKYSNTSTQGEKLIKGIINEITELED